jgi:hypothetical protein
MLLDAFMNRQTTRDDDTIYIVDFEFLIPILSDALLPSKYGLENRKE